MVPVLRFPVLRFPVLRFPVLRTLVLLWLLAPAALAEPAVHVRIDRAVNHYVVDDFYGYVVTSTQDETLLTQRGLGLRDRASFMFYPTKQSVEVVEAWVDQPDGARVIVPASSIFTRVSPTAANSNGFVTSRTTTVLFPQLRIGSRTHVVWKMNRRAPAIFGFNMISTLAFPWDTKLLENRIDIPARLRLTWRARGGFAVEDTTDGKIRHIVARILDRAGEEAEPGMVNLSDFQPEFIATSLVDYNEIGAITARAAKGTGAVQPSLQVLADTIVGDRLGEDAARAIHDWVKTNLRPTTLALNPVEGFAPRPAMAVLQSGYGDGRDLAALTQALLAARAIPSELVLVEEGLYAAEPLLWTASRFNQVILYLPDFDRYVNMFNRFAPYDALQPNLGGKLAVHVTDAGRQAQTPPNSPTTYRYHAKLHTSLDESGTLSGHVDFDLSPNAEAFLRSQLAEASSSEALAGQSLTATAEGGVGSYTASNPRDLSRRLEASADWTSPRVLNRLAGAWTMQVPQGVGPLTLAGLRGLLPQSEAGARRTPIWVGARDYCWDVAIALPAGWQVKRLPRNVLLENRIGRYEARYRVEGQTVLVSRRLVVTHDVAAPEDYPAVEALAYAPAMDARGLVFLVGAQ